MVQIKNSIKALEADQVSNYVKLSKLKGSIRTIKLKHANDIAQANKSLELSRPDKIFKCELCHREYIS